MNKKGLVWYELGKWVIILAGAVIIIMFISSLATGKLPSAIKNLIDALRFGR